MRILGIDPGSETTGFGVIEAESRRLRFVACGTIKASTKSSFAARLLKISNGVEELIEQYSPAACAIEDAFYAANIKTAMKLGQVRGVILVAAERAALEIAEYAPRLVKQTVVGYGAAEKHQVGEMVRLLMNLPSVPQPHDASDALAIAICHAHHLIPAARINQTAVNRRTTITASELVALRRRA